jgi:putative membrane protein
MYRWSFDPLVLMSLAVAGAVYWRGQQIGLVPVGRASKVTRRRRQKASFFAGLLVIFLALQSPVDSLGASLFWAHMVQHLMLIMIAAPLLVLGDAAIPLVRGLPLSLRRRGLGFASRQPVLRKLGHALSLITAPAPVLVIFLGNTYLWHWSRLFDLTLQNGAVHVLEHLCFLVTALLFWSRVIDQRGIHARLSDMQRVLYLLTAGFTTNFLAMYFVFAPHPLYSAYANLASRPYGMTVLTDQQLAGGIMWVPVLFIFGGAATFFLFRILGQEDSQRQLGTYTVLIGPTDHAERI